MNARKNQAHMGRRDFLGIIAAGAMAAWCGRAGVQAPKKRPPNIVIILADDLGYADLGCQGCKDIPTPNIDSIAASGVRFTDGYANHPVCSPSRAGLMSGRYQHRFGFEHNSGPEEFAADNFGLPRDEKTLAERLKELGYATGMVGKWHIGFKEGLRPHERGFDTHFGFLSGAHAYLPGEPDVNPLVRNGQPVAEKEYLTDAFAREAEAVIEHFADRPFFLYLAFNAVHYPLQSIQPYLQRFGAIQDPKRKTYAAMLSAMDDAVGRVLANLRARQLEENTLIFFYSDNGGPTAQTTSSNLPLRGYKGMVTEGGIRVPFMAQWKGVLPAGKTYAEPVMAFDIHATALIAAGGALPETKPLDGVDLMPYLTGKKDGAPHERLVWRSGEQHALRSGDWKLVKMPAAATALYNLRNDIGEGEDLSAKEPAKLKELQAAYDAWAKEMTPAQWIRQTAQTQGAGKKGTKARVGKAKHGAVAMGGTPEENFAALDRNRDGKVTPGELPRPLLFQRLDANGDGAITLEEAKAFGR